MKRIVNVSNFSVIRLKNCFVNDIIIKISNGLIRNGYEVINYSDRDMLRFFSPFKIFKTLGKETLQKEFIDFCKKTQPDAILLCHADTITTHTLLQIKKLLPNIKIMQYNLDAIRPGIKENDANILKLQDKLPAVDATLITTGDKKLLSQFNTSEDKYVGFLPNPVDKSLETGLVYQQQHNKYDLMFGATSSKRKFCGEYVLCSDIIKSINDSVKNIKMNVFGIDKLSRLEGPDYQNAYLDCAMGLNLSRINDCYLYSSDRMAHIMGNGQLCVMEDASGFKDIFSDSEVCFYKNEKEMLEKISFYKNNPLERMVAAKKGHDKYVELFNEKLVAKYITDILFGKLNKNDYVWTKLID